MVSTTKLYGRLDRRTNVTTAVACFQALHSPAYVYNSANQRTRRIESDGSDWRFNYDPLVEGVKP